MSDKYILQGHKTVPVDDLIEWGTAFGKADRTVGLTKLPNDVSVSTVFLGLDHGFGEGPPILFETMIFGGEHDQYEERYTTWEEAEEGHKRAVELATSKVKTDDNQN